MSTPEKVANAKVASQGRDRLARRRLGDILVEQGKVTREDVESVLVNLPKEHRELMGELLVARNLITEQDLAQALALQNGYRYIDLSRVTLDPSLAKHVPERMARLNRLAPVALRDNVLVVAMADPSHSFVLDSIQMKTGFKIEPTIALERDILAALDLVYNKRAEETLQDILQQTRTDALEIVDGELDENSELGDSGADEAPVIRLVNHYVSEAIRRGTSDLHVEPKESKVMVRLRIDGVLHPIESHPKRLHNAVVSRIKIMSELNISERRLPQDGRFKVKTGSRVVDFRVSVLPTVYGEKVVLRLLDSSTLLLDPKELGFLPDQREIFEKSLSKPYGMVMVTGPTGSGKTTTLYSALKRIADPSKNIITVEDPVEYRLEQITQVQTHSSIGLNFAAALRSILRQDPDVVMVGEVRDLETAEIAIKASLTGHFVLTTLHTNDSASAVTRLADMGIPPYLITASLVLVIAQRLARRNCEDCRESFEATPTMLETLGLHQRAQDVIQLYRGAGCERCNGTGYKGRLAAYEMLVMNDALRRYVLDRMSASELKTRARQQGMSTMRESAVRRVLEGATSPDEILRVTFDDELLEPLNGENTELILPPNNGT